MFLAALISTLIQSNNISGNGIECEIFNISPPFSTNTPKLAQPTGNFSRYNLSVVLDEVNSFIDGNLTVDFYNNDDLNFTKIPFHIYLSGMEYDSRPGIIEIVKVTDVNNPSITFPFEVYSNQQIMWVNISEKLEPTSWNCRWVQRSTKLFTNV